MTFNQGVTGSRPVRPTKLNRPPLPGRFEKNQGSDGRLNAVSVRLAEAEVKEELPSAEEITETPEAVEEDSTEAP